MTENTHSITNQSVKLADIRAAMLPLGAKLDRNDLDDDSYWSIDTEYESLFDQLCDAEDALLVAPIESVADILSKASVIADRLRLGRDDIAADIERLERQIGDWLKRN